MSRTIPWEKYLPSLKERAADIKRRREKREKASWNVVFDLLNVPLGKLIAEIKKRDPERERYGFLPYMAKTWLGRLMAESFSERMLSNANIVLNPSNMRLNPVEMEQLVVLRMNRDFMVSRSLSCPISCLMICSAQWISLMCNLIPNDLLSPVDLSHVQSHA
jgi:hypothetical protein